MTTLPDLRLTGALCLVGSTLEDADIALSQGRIVQPAHTMPALDLTGYWLLPGIVDLHGDGFERHIRPRPSAPFDKRAALQAADTELASQGVTTAWFAQSWSWEGGARSPDEAVALLEARRQIAHRLGTDIRIQLRFETHMPRDHTALLAVVRDYHLDYIVFNNHLPEALEMAKHKPDRFAIWAGMNGHSPDALLAIVQEAHQADAEIPAFLTALAADLVAAGVTLGSHDDPDTDTRAFFRKIGARVCEFPTSVAAAQSARNAGEPVLMGAPNVVRGGSQSGNIAAMDLVEDGLCDALISDYYIPALAQAAWAIADARALSFAHAWEMISTAPARIMGLEDRGQLRPDQRADLVVMNPNTRRIEATIAGGRILHATGEVARRLLAPAYPSTLAAQ
ncbi:Alpha-D-ribose 1-methylphosphonate 5-triphosphate diphosphatase [Roseibaca ekhonensis]|jgi:alpha-D-ribose 1-methylphosphonate 5-triphosphate diphosphatase|uniref:Alpha-D-ribose 1-methylphosphonate 5-triphosphate diphosphatase n=1 Tax=Roseinatronobacter ekhonensis TaxID=254356 RepID=A0A3B0M723_9RHOB|nr:alpha-D-ribose 1-methylphosphonate 5-triphosphate diphosphatase [Roseibaca ekhonensis]SUZ31795.1 Alpha-D-ribose 1-methylphosphonate 5-triphosphate diphosphatase [Roseibaca ekhonensis]